MDAVCPIIVKKYYPDSLIRSCPVCNRFFARCCHHDKNEVDGVYDRPAKTCHHFRIIYTDGACLNNGIRGAMQAAGMGIAMGTDSCDQRSIPIDDSVDPGGARTSQRAELLAAIEALSLWTARWADPDDAEHQLHDPRGKDGDWGVNVIIATDSEYVAKGISEWYPNWKVRNSLLHGSVEVLTRSRQSRGWRGADGRRPANLDLFHKLNDVVAHLEEVGVRVGFLRLERAVSVSSCLYAAQTHVISLQYNALADQLAKQAARVHAPSTAHVS